jgi:photosystem II stability/assembly factor-like uncharacterized protein
MDNLRNDLRAAFARQQSRLGDLRGARETLVRRALERRDKAALDGRLQFAAGIAAVLIAALVIGTLTYMRGRGIFHEGPVPGTASPSRLATPLTSPSPVSESPRLAANGWVVDADLVGGLTGWVLLSTCIQPMTGQCHYSVARTADGGATWSKPVQVGPGFDPADGGAPRHIHFINVQDGFVYGGVVAYATHDAGQTWSSVSVHQTFISLMAGWLQRAWLITYPCAKGVNCPFDVRTSVDAGRTWSAPHALPLNFTPSNAIAFGTAGLLVASEPGGDMEVTRDGGATWTFIKTQCTASNFIAKVATAGNTDGSQLWELCMDYPDASRGNVSHKVLFVSDDGGQTWSRRATWVVSAQQAGSGYLIVLAANGPETAVMATNQSSITLTKDGGRTWTDVGPPGIGFMSLRFPDLAAGWALDVNQYIWATSDAGNTWTQLPAIPQA